MTKSIYSEQELWIIINNSTQTYENTSRTTHWVDLYHRNQKGNAKKVWIWICTLQGPFLAIFAMELGERNANK